MLCIGFWHTSEKLSPTASVHKVPYGCLTLCEWGGSKPETLRGLAFNEQMAGLSVDVMLNSHNDQHCTFVELL